MKLLTVGSPAPHLSALNQEGEEIFFGDVYKKGTTLVSFYPKASNPGCNTEACSLRDAFETLQDQDGKKFRFWE